MGIFSAKDLPGGMAESSKIIIFCRAVDGYPHTEKDRLMPMGKVAYFSGVKKEVLIEECISSKTYLLYEDLDGSYFLHNKHASMLIKHHRIREINRALNRRSKQISRFP